MMSENSLQLLEHALALPAQERAELATRLLESLQSLPDQRFDDLWIRESEDRLDAYDRGELRAIPAEDVFNKINQQRSDTLSAPSS